MNIQNTDNISDDEIFELFKYRCVVCKKRATVIHEIEPRSSGNSAMNLENRVTLCNNCHGRIHNDGVGNSNIVELQKCRRAYLLMIGRGEYA
jgi:5-methylcytosine-specific restriction endonuclease McrA